MTTRPDDQAALDPGDEDPDSLAGDPVPGDIDLSHLPAADALSNREKA